MKTGKIILGFLAGAAGGAILGLLLAPDKGTETRKKIAKKGNDYMEEMKGKFNNLAEDLTEKFEEVLDEVTEFAKMNKMPKTEVKKDEKTVMN